MATSVASSSTCVQVAHSRRSRVHRGSAFHRGLTKQNGFISFFGHRQCRRLAAISTAAIKKAVDDWGALAGDDVADEEDPDFIEFINDLSNRALRAMLDGDIQASMKLKDELDEIGAIFVQQKNMEAGKFIFILLNMLDHKLTTKLQLTGLYLKAYEKLYGLLEDSGYALIEEEEGDESKSNKNEEDDVPKLPSVGLYNKR